MTIPFDERAKSICHLERSITHILTKHGVNDPRGAIVFELLNAIDVEIFDADIDEFKEEED